MRYGPHVALYLIGTLQGDIDEVDALDLLFGGVEHRVRIFVPPHHLADSVRDDQGAGFRLAISLQWPTTTGEAELVVRVRGGRRHFLYLEVVWPADLDADDSVGAIPSAPHGGRSHAPSSVKVAVVPHAGGTGGAQWWLGEVTRRLRTLQGVDVRELPPSRGPRGEQGLYVARTDAAFSEAVDRAARALEHAGPDLVLVNTIEGLATAEACRRLGVPYAWAIHESYSPPVLWSSVFEFIAPGHTAVRALDESLAGASRLLFVSSETQDRLSAGHGQGTVVRFGVATPEAAHARGGRQAWGVPDDALLVVSVGTLEERKNPGLLVAAMGRARRTLPQLHLLLAGPGPMEYAMWLRRTADRVGLATGYTHVRRTVQVHELLPLADLYVSASDAESRPVVLLEAMAAMVPVVATHACGVAEIIEDGVGGVITPLGDLDALTRAIVTLGSNPALRSSLAREAYERLRSIPADWADEAVAAVMSAVGR